MNWMNLVYSDLYVIISLNFFPDLNVSNHQDGSQCLDFDVDQNQEVKSMASSHDPDAGINRSSDELDLLTPCFGAHSVPDLTSGLVTSRHTRYGASTTAKTHRPLRDYNVSLLSRSKRSAKLTFLIDVTRSCGVI